MENQPFATSDAMSAAIAAMYAENERMENMSERVIGCLLSEKLTLNQAQRVLAMVGHKLRDRAIIGD